MGPNKIKQAFSLLIIQLTLLDDIADLKDEEVLGYIELFSDKYFSTNYTVDNI